MGRRGRPRGRTSTCSFCGEPGHNARGTTCSASAIAERLMADGYTQADAARTAGLTSQGVTRRMHTVAGHDLMLADSPHIEEHW